MKILKKIILPLVLACIMLFTLVGCVSESDVDSLKSQLEQLQAEIEDLKGSKADSDKTIEELEAELALLKAGKSTADKSYDKLKYIDANLRDRDCRYGANFKAAQSWIKELALASGYDESAVATQDVTITTYVNKNVDLEEKYSAANGLSTDGKYYTKSGKNYVEDPEGNYVKVEFITQNIIITKTGKSEKQIIVGAHYDGTGTGDNGSGVALALTTAEELATIDTPYTIKFAFFTAEEIGGDGATAYAESLTEDEIANTLYMINLDSLTVGDYCYIYGGVQHNDTKTVTETEAYDNAMAISKSFGLDIRSNPWTWDNPEPGRETPKYASPSTGSWSDHYDFVKIGIKYLYMEATNWEIAPYNGYGETYLAGMLMNTDNDYLEYIERFFPGRAQHHFSQFAPLLHALLVQEKVKF